MDEAKNEEKKSGEAPFVNIPTENGNIKLEGFSEETMARTNKLMSDLSKFAAGREEILKKLSTVSDRIQNRMKNGGSFDYSEYKNATIDPMKHETASRREKPNSSTFNPIFTKVAYTRVAETNAPVCLPQMLIIYMPKAIAMTDEWFERLATLNRSNAEKKYKLPISKLQRDEGSLTIGPGSYANIPTGIKLYAPNNAILIPETYNPCLELIAPKSLPYDNEAELEVAIRNISDEDITIKSDEPLVFMRCVRVYEMSGEEMLNSTYSDFIKGNIK